MNGEERDRLTILETLFKSDSKIRKERWDNHDKRSEEIWKRIEKQLTKLDLIPCAVNEEKIKSINNRITFMWVVIVLIVGIFKLVIK